MAGSTKTLMNDPGAGLAALAERYDGFLVDQYGVLHDGVRPYEGAVACLARLNAAGKRVVVLSNSGKRAAANAVRLAALGIPPSLYTALVSSGEAAWHALAARTRPEYAALGHRCLLLSRGGDRSIVDGLDLDLVAQANEADFVLLSGSDAPARTFADYEAALAAAAARRLPMLCANPDITAVDGPRTTMGPGVLARRYEALGGRVHYVGKPHRDIYDHALGALGVAPERVLALGDSLEHDIRGGADAGVATALILAGIHAEALAGAPADRRAALDRLCRAYGVTPTFVLDRLCW